MTAFSASLKIKEEKWGGGEERGKKGEERKRGGKKVKKEKKERRNKRLEKEGEKEDGDKTNWEPPCHCHCIQKVNREWTEIS